MRAVSHRAPVSLGLLSLLLGAVIPLAGVATAAPAAADGAAYPKQATCVDAAAALGTDTCNLITQVLRADEQATGDRLAVAVVRSTGGVPISTWGAGLLNAWHLGGPSRSALLVVAVADHRPDVVTGRGLAGRLPAGTASAIVADKMAPLLGRGQTRAAVLTGLDALRRALHHRVTGANSLAAAAGPPEVMPTGPPVVTLPSAEPTPPPQTSGSNRLAWLGLFGCLAAVGLGGYIRRMRRTRGAQYAHVPNRQRPWWAQERRWWSGVLPGSAAEVEAPSGRDLGGGPTAGGGASSGR